METDQSDILLPLNVVFLWWLVRRTGSGLIWGVGICYNDVQGMKSLDGHRGLGTCRCQIDPAAILIDNREEKGTLGC